MCMGVDKKVSKKSTVYWQQKEGYVLTFLYTMWSTHGWGGGGGRGLQIILIQWNLFTANLLSQHAFSFTSLYKMY